MAIRVLIVDDEPLARLRIRDLLKPDSRFEVAGEAATGRKAAAAIQKDRPDLIFLDVQMPGMDGFGVIEAVGPANMPCVIFVTAYDQYALKAFDVRALDYLLKPFDPKRFREALDRAARQIRMEKSGSEFSLRLEELIQEVKAGKHYPDRVLVKSKGRISFLKADQIEWVEAAANYVVLHAGNEEHLLREMIGEIEKRLDPAKFVRIHRSAIVNVNAIKELQPLFHGEYSVILKNGVTLTLSRTYRDRLNKIYLP